MNLFVLFLILGGAGLWWYLAGSYETALRAAKEHCSLMGVQFLDGSVQRAGFGLTRNKADTMVLVQKFQFVFATTGEERYNGYTQVVGKRVIKMELEPHKID